MPRRLDTDEQDRLIEAYQAWTPGDESIDSLAERLGVPKATLYNVLARRKVPLKTRRPEGDGTRSGVPQIPEEFLDVMVERAFDYLLQRLYEQQETIHVLQARLEANGLSPEV